MWKVVREQQLHPCHWQYVQALDTNHYLRSGQFVLSLCTTAQRRPTFPQWCCSRMRPASTGTGFSTTTIVMFDQTQTLIAASPHCHLQRFAVNFWASIVHEFLIGPYLLPRRLSIQIYRMFLEEKLPEMLEEIPLAFKEKRMVPGRCDCHSICTSGLRTSHCHLQRSLDWTGRACGLAFQVSGPHTNGLLTMRSH